MSGYIRGSCGGASVESASAEVVWPMKFGRRQSIATW
jgi:hypothetical protein